MHTSVPEILREASEDNILPLSKPIVGRSGKAYHEIFIPRGSMIHASAAGYNTYVWRFFRVDCILSILSCLVGTLMYGAVMPGFSGLIAGLNRM